MVSTAQHLKTKLSFVWVHGNEFKANVTVTTTDSCYLEGELKAGLPPDTEGAPETEYLSFQFTHEGERCAKIVRDVTKSITSRISPGARDVTAYVVVNGKVAGHASAPIPRGK
jgi:hypothetical protein